MGFSSTRLSFLKFFVPFGIEPFENDINIAEVDLEATVVRHKASDDKWRKPAIFLSTLQVLCKVSGLWR